MFQPSELRCVYKGCELPQCKRQPVSNVVNNIKKVWGCGKFLSTCVEASHTDSLSLPPSPAFSLSQETGALLPESWRIPTLF